MKKTLGAVLCIVLGNSFLITFATDYARTGRLWRSLLLLGGVWLVAVSVALVHAAETEAKADKHRTDHGDVG
jgi:type II secretory pathway component PulL